jgi:endoglycosylceramidase
LIIINTIFTEGLRFIDDEGRERIFNGLNFVFKGEKTGFKKINYYPDWERSLFESLNAKGINIIRLGLIWDAVEPEPGKYNEKYLDFISGIIDRCYENEIYVYLDMHQDLYSCLFSDGAPEWATLTDGKKYKEPRFIWAEGYFYKKAVHRAFDNFWLNKEVDGKGLQDYYCDMWKYISYRFKDKRNIFGFDIMNEPFPGTEGGKVFRKIVIKAIKTVLLSREIKTTRLLRDLLNEKKRAEALSFLDNRIIFSKIFSAGKEPVRKFDIEAYYPFLEKTATAIREVTQNGIIIMENCYYSNISIPCSTPKLKYKNGALEPLLCFSPHGYDLTVDSPLANKASNARIDFIFDEHKKTQERLGVPVIVGEWGAFNPGENEYPHLEHLLKKFDENKWSQTYWCYQDGLLEDKILDLLSRPYPKATAGKIESYNYDRRRNIFNMKYICENENDTVIYLHKKPREINTSGTYEIKPIKNHESSDLIIKAEKGLNRITVKF